MTFPLLSSYYFFPFFSFFPFFTFSLYFYLFPFSLWLRFPYPSSFYLTSPLCRSCLCSSSLSLPFSSLSLLSCIPPALYSPRTLSLLSSTCPHSPGGASFVAECGSRRSRSSQSLLFPQSTLPSVCSSLSLLFPPLSPSFSHNPHCCPLPGPNLRVRLSFFNGFN